MATVMPINIGRALMTEKKRGRRRKGLDVARVPPSPQGFVRPLAAASATSRSGNDDAGEFVHGASSSQ